MATSRPLAWAARSPMSGQRPTETGPDGTVSARSHASPTGRAIVVVTVRNDTSPMTPIAEHRSSVAQEVLKLPCLSSPDDSRDVDCSTIGLRYRSPLLLPIGRESGASGAPHRWQTPRVAPHSQAPIIFEMRSARRAGLPFVSSTLSALDIICSARLTPIQRKGSRSQSGDL